MHRQMYCPACRNGITLVENSTCITNAYGIWHMKCCRIIRKNPEHPEVDINGPGKMVFLKKAEGPPNVPEAF